MPDLISSTPWWQWRSARMALVVVLASLAFIQTLGGGFISDDGYMILNRTEHFQSAKGLGDLLTNVYWWGTDLPQARQHLYRPWIAFTYWFEYQISGDSPAVYHLSNFLVHVVNTILLFLLLELLSGTGVATIVALLFAVSPSALTSVGWIAGRTDLWALLFVLTFLILLRQYQIYGRVWHAIAASIALFLGLCSKEIAIVAPVLWLLLEYVRPTSKRDNSTRRGYAIPAAIMLIPLTVFVVLRQSRPIAESAIAAGGSEVLSELPYLAERVVRTALQALIPTGYSFYSEFIWSLPNQRGFVFAVVWGGLIALLLSIVWGLRRRQLWAVGGSWFVLVVVPPYAFGQVWAPISSIYAYAGLPGLWLMLIEGVASCARRKSWKIDFASPRMLAGTGILGLGYALLSFSWAPILKTDMSLTTHMVNREPNSVRALVGLGDNYRLNGDLARAAELYQRAVRSDSSSIEPHIQLCKLYLGANDPERATQHVEALLRIAPTHPEAQALAGRFFYESGDYQRAAAAFQQSFAFGNPSNETLFDFGMLLLRMQRYQEAGGVYSEIVRREPSWSAAYSNLGLCHESLGQFDAAVKAYQKALELDPASVDVHASLAFAYARLGNRESAILHAKAFASKAPASERTERFIAEFGQMGLLPGSTQLEAKSAGR